MRQKVQTLSLTYPRMAFPGTPLLYRLPGLRSVTLGGDFYLGRIDRHLLYDALASLPHLEELGLPGGGALDGVESLAGSLRTLKIGFQLGFKFNEANASVIRGLRRLETLSVDLSFEPGQLCLVLDAVPRSLHTLTLLRYTRLGAWGTAVLRLEGGRVVSLDSAHTDFRLEELAQFVQDELLPVAAASLQRIALRSLYMDSGSSKCGDDKGDDAERTTHASTLAVLRRVLAPGGRYEVATVTAASCAPIKLVEESLALLGGGAGGTDLVLFVNEEDELQISVRVQRTHLVECDTERPAHVLAGQESPAAPGGPAAAAALAAPGPSFFASIVQCLPPARVEVAAAVARVMAAAERAAADRAGRPVGTLEVVATLVPKDEDQADQSGWIALVGAMQEAAQTVMEFPDTGRSRSCGRGAGAGSGCCVAGAGEGCCGSGEVAGKGSDREDGSSGLRSGRQQLRWLLCQWEEVRDLWGMYDVDTTELDYDY
ncbi:hypothetical protein GPECTOR_1g237 [Gonium pectorale]|uniref:Uncharacterized protein n=1 Tax=Gonium pectorale TaxID=33097 RepID=A0A150H2G9_GONPE|nr:hypothetical protein GPECTOR_1g237 [Gonium pectorale]|eukprot:KXZ56271.1 hypothetical protein GPECTOR_1g237 [Gonium pectorale]